MPLALDEEATEAIRQERLHQKIATAVFFESNGGTTRSEATLPEIRLAVGHPDLDLGNIETALDALTDKCYYLAVERKNYKFSLKENLNKRFSDKRRTLSRRKSRKRSNRRFKSSLLPKRTWSAFFFPRKAFRFRIVRLSRSQSVTWDTRWKTKKPPRR